MRIVIVEDEAGIREGLADLIEEDTEHTVVETCRNGEEGLKIIRQVEPDLVITDIRMDTMTGLDMLHELSDMKKKPYAIIISGYSEFEYARRAVYLGVDEYLMKPIAVNELKGALERVDEKLQERDKRIEKQTADYAQEYLLGFNHDNIDIEERLKREFGKTPGECYGILLGYFGNTERMARERANRCLERLKRQHTNLVYLDLWLESPRYKVLLMKGEPEGITSLTDELDQILVRSPEMKNQEIPWGMQLCQDISDWRNTFLKIEDCLAICLIEGCQKVVRCEAIAYSDKRELGYPTAIEKKIILRTSEEDFQGVTEAVDEFLGQLQKNCQDPREIRRGSIKLLLAMSDTIKEINREAYEQIRRNDYISKINAACTMTELRHWTTELARLSCDKRDQGGVSNYMIKRVIAYIKDHYKEGISLEEMADTLQITPEYLSILFKREMGKNFSVFLKEYRISQARRMLKSTDMKIYEIAEACGYSNSNYFAKVFKEITGVTPAEYRS